MSGLIFIADAVENRLNSMGSSWRFHIEDPTKRDQLEQIITQSIYDVEFNLYSGRVDYKAGEKRTVVATGFRQSQPGGRVLVFHDNRNENDPQRFKYPNLMLWRTHDGEIPRYKPMLVEETAKVNLIVEIIYLTVAFAFILVLLLVPIWIFAKKKRITKKMKVQTAKHFGLLLIEIIIIIYPLASRLLFCQVAPVLALFGYLLVMWSNLH